MSTLTEFILNYIKFQNKPNALLFKIECINMTKLIKSADFDISVVL